MLLDIHPTPQEYFLLFSIVLVVGIAVAAALVYVIYLPFQIYFMASGKMTEEQKRKIDWIFFRTLFSLLLAVLLALPVIYYFF